MEEHEILSKAKAYKGCKAKVVAKVHGHLFNIGDEITCIGINHVEENNEIGIKSGVLYPYSFNMYELNGRKFTLGENEIKIL